MQYLNLLVERRVEVVEESVPQIFVVGQVELPEDLKEASDTRGRDSNSLGGFIRTSWRSGRTSRCQRGESPATLDGLENRGRSFHLRYWNWNCNNILYNISDNDGNINQNPDQIISK